MFQPSYVKSLFAILSSKNLRSTFLSFQTKRGRPRYRMGKEVFVAGKLRRMGAKLRWLHLIGTTELLWKFVHNPLRWRSSRMYFHLTESKALRMSSLKRREGV